VAVYAMSVGAVVTSALYLLSNNCAFVGSLCKREQQCL